MCDRCGTVIVIYCVFFFQAEDGIRDAQESRGLGDVYKRQVQHGLAGSREGPWLRLGNLGPGTQDGVHWTMFPSCLLYTSDAADDLLCVDLGGRRIIKKKNTYCHVVRKIDDTKRGLSYTQHVIGKTSCQQSYIRITN